MDQVSDWNWNAMKDVNENEEWKDELRFMYQNIDGSNTIENVLVSERWAPGPPFPFIKAPYIYHYTPTKALSLPKLRFRN